MNSAPRGARLAFGMFSVVPVGEPHVDRRTVAAAVLWMPFVGAVVAALAVLPALLVWHGRDHGSPLVAAVVLVAAGALLTRGLHLDGLADLADGLGSNRPADEAIEIMRRSDIGPFGVVTLLLALFVQVASIASVLDGHAAPLGLALVVASSTTARLSVAWAATRRTPPARPDGLGALVAGSLTRVEALLVTLAVVIVAGAAARLLGANAGDLIWLLAAMLVGLLASFALRRHAVRRIGGVTGDVFGALVELSATVTLLVLAAEGAWR